MSPGQFTHENCRIKSKRFLSHVCVFSTDIFTVEKPRYYILEIAKFNELLIALTLCNIISDKIHDVSVTP